MGGAVWTKDGAKDRSEMVADLMVASMAVFVMVGVEMLRVGVLMRLSTVKRTCLIEGELIKQSKEKTSN